MKSVKEVVGDLERGWERWRDESNDTTRKFRVTFYNNYENPLERAKKDLTKSARVVNEGTLDLRYLIEDTTVGPCFFHELFVDGVLIP